MGYKLYSRGYIDLGANTICLPCFITTSYSKLDNEFLQNIGGINDNSFVKILNPEIDEDCEENCSQIINHSSYYDSGTLSSTLQTCKNKFTILSANIQSINAKINEFRLFIESLKNYNFMFSAICVQESWLLEGDDTSLVQLDGYECIPQGKVCSTQGGLLIYLHENFKHKLKLKFDKYETWEGQILLLKITKQDNQAIQKCYNEILTSNKLIN